MKTLLSLILDGASIGSLYGLLALGLVLIYRASKLVNFAHGEMAMFSTYMAWVLMQHMKPALAIPCIFALSFSIGIAVDVVILRRIKEERPLNAVIVTIGLFTIFNSLVVWKFGAIQKPFPSIFGDSSFHLNGLTIPHATVGTLVASLGIVLVLGFLFRFTRLGLAMRACAINWNAARLMGIRIEWMFAISWGLASVLGVVAGMLIAPKVFLYPAMMQTILTYAFAAAVVGGLESPMGAVIGGLIVGIAESFAGAWPPIGAELKTVVAVALLVGVLLVRPRGLFGSAELRKV